MGMDGRKGRGRDYKGGRVVLSLSDAERGWSRYFVKIKCVPHLNT